MKFFYVPLAHKYMVGNPTAWERFRRALFAGKTEYAISLRPSLKLFGPRIDDIGEHSLQCVYRIVYEPNNPTLSQAVLFGEIYKRINGIKLKGKKKDIPNVPSFRFTEPNVVGWKVGLFLYSKREEFVFCSVADVSGTIKDSTILSKALYYWTIEMLREPINEFRRRIDGIIDTLGIM